MRWVRTEVLPVPAPATTSMGPWTCSMASRWRSSGVNGVGRELDFGDGINGRISLAEWRSPTAILRAKKPDILTVRRAGTPDRTAAGDVDATVVLKLRSRWQRWRRFRHAKS